MKLLVQFLKNCSSIQQNLVDVFINYLGQRNQESPREVWWHTLVHCRHIFVPFRDIHATKYLKANILLAEPHPIICRENCSKHLSILWTYKYIRNILESWGRCWYRIYLKNFSLEFRLCLHTLEPQITLQYLKRRPICSETSLNVHNF